MYKKSCIDLKNYEKGTLGRRTLSRSEWTENEEKGRLGKRTFSNDKWTENEELMKVDHFGSGGRRSDSRLGRRGKKLGDCGIVELWRNRDF